MIHFTNLEYMVLTDPRTAFVCLEMVISGRRGDYLRGCSPHHYCILKEMVKVDKTFVCVFVQWWYDILARTSTNSSTSELLRKPNVYAVDSLVVHERVCICISRYSTCAYEQGPFLCMHVCAWI